MASEPVATLRERLRLALHFGDTRPRSAAEQTMANPQRHFPADTHAQPLKHFERVGHAPVGGVLNRDDAEVGMAPIHFFEHRGNAADRHLFDRLPKWWSAARWL